MKSIWIVVLTILFCHQAYSKELRVGIWNNPPLSITKNEKIEGFAPDIFNYIADSQNIKYTFIKGKWQDLYSQLERGEIDIFMPIGYSEERLKTMDFSAKPIFTNWGQIITRKDKKINDISDLNNTRLAIQKNDIYFFGSYGLYHLMKSLKFNYEIVDVDNYIEALDKILKGEVDAALVGKSFTFTTNSSEIKITNIFVQPISVHFAYRKGLDNSTKNKIDKGLTTLIEDQNSYYYKRLQYMYDTGYSENIVTHFFIKYGQYVTSIFILIIIILFIFNKILKKRVLEKTSTLTQIVEKLKASEEKLNTILNSVPSVIFIVDKNHTYIDILAKRDDLLLMPREAVIGKKVEELFDSKKAEFFVYYIDDVIINKAKVNFLYDLQIKGEVRYFEAIGIPFKLNGDILALFQIIEQTDLIKLSEELRLASYKLSVEKDKLNRILNSIQELVIVTDREGVIIYMNNAAKNVISEDFINSKLEYVEIYTINDNSKQKFDIHKVIEKGYNEDTLKDLYIKKGDSKIDIECSIQPIYNYDSNISVAVIVIRDITEEKRINDQLIKSDKIEAIGRLASGIAHDFNNYLGAIQNYVNVLKIKDDKEISNIAEQMETIIEKSKNLSKQLLTFAKGGSPVIKQTCITNIIKSVSEFSLKGSNISLELTLSDDCVCCMIDEGLFSQVISNIVINAREAMNDIGHLKIDISTFELSKENQYGVEGGNYAKISIKDSGPGIPENIRDKVFEPFYTTKSNGTGLGLATSFSIIKQHNGYINFVNHPDGCEFIILLKNLNKDQCHQNSYIKESVSKITASDIKILYMDDEDFLRDSFELLMSALNCKTETFANGEEVLEAVQKDNYDIIVLDLTIRNGMNGSQTIKRLKEMRIESYFVVSSGYSDDPVLQNLKDYGFDDHLLKPYSLKEAREMLDRFLKKKNVLISN